MDDGLIQFLVIAVVIIVSMMDGASRKRRREAQSSQSLATYDDVPEAGDDPHQVTESSEGIVPQDLWDGIAALARGEVPGGEVRSLRVLAFYEPLDYLPTKRWYRQFEAKSADAALRLGRDIHGVVGSTLSSRAATAGVRRALALHRVLLSETDTTTARTIAASVAN